MANPTDILLNDISLSTAIYINENTTDLTDLGGLTAVDSDSGQTYTFSITSDPLGAFEISSGVLRIKSGGNALLEFDTATSHTIEITVTDSGGGSFVKNLTINLLNDVGGPVGTNVDDYIEGTGTGNVLNGHDGNDSIDGGGGDDTMTGGAGNDTFVLDSASDIVSEALDQGIDTVKIGVTYSLVDTDGAGANGGYIENLTLTGTANVNATGNGWDNVLTGNSGNNSISGGAGDDTMIGGAGNDTFVVADTGDVVQGGSGTDLVESSLSTYSLLDTDKDGSTADDDVENLTLVGTALTGIGNALDNVLTGNALNNTLRGGAGNDSIVGGTGVDSMDGGLGNDTYVVDETTDKVSESAASGTDLVQSSVTFALGVNVENLTLTGTDAIDGTGNTLGNTIIGNTAANVIDGGTGDDSMNGGDGDDTIYVRDAGDTVVGGDGTDLVISAISTHTLASDAENLTLFQNSTVIEGVGNTLTNHIIGNTASNKLDGGADALADTMEGGAGHDTYVVRTGDVVIEQANSGTDLVRTAIAAYTLTEFVENLELTGTSGSSATGNDLVNVIDASADTGNNLLDGKGGKDTMKGGQGNDTYIVDTLSEGVIEADNSGTNTDLVRASVNFTLGEFVENLELTGTDTGTTADTDGINGTGNDLANTITGNAGNNLIDGKGGADSMNGGAGDDTFVVDAAGDTVVGGAGTDLIRSTVTISLVDTDGAGSNGAEVENLTLEGTDNVNATGNHLANELTGNSGDNLIDSGQNAAATAADGVADTMTGGAGNDTYVVRDALDTIENDAAGTDTVQSHVSFELGTSLEHLTLMGTAAIDATGNAGNNELTGNSGANRLDGKTGIDNMKGGAGADTYVLDRSEDVVDEEGDTGTGDRIEAGFTFTLASLTDIEELRLTGDMAINGTGNGSANLLIGNTGANKLDGAEGNDTLEGGAGNDTYVVNAGQTVVINEVANEGTDEVWSEDTFALNDVALQHVENISLTGSATGVNATGNSRANKLVGNAEGNVLDGGVEATAAADSMYGGLGDDTYMVRDAGDLVVENTNAGSDTVRTHLATTTLQANFENLILEAGSAALDGTGNGANNHLTGNASANKLDGKFGIDTMVGGDGADTYVVDNVSDNVTELAGDLAVDVVRSWAATYTLSANVETLELMGTIGTKGYGNSDANTITGNTGDNFIDGNGGGDAMSGKAGNDTYVVRHASDTVTEVSDEGTDEVQFALQRTSDLFANVENLRLLGTVVEGHGNSLANRLTGNGSDNILDGKTGADVMAGGAGNDSYFVDNIGDQVIEVAGQGTADHVSSTIAFSLQGTNVEHLTLTGSANINATGSSGVSNTIIGTSGNNRIDGLSGADSMTGNGGNDTFVVDTLSDTVVGGSSTDWIEASLTYSIASNAAIENLKLLNGGVNATGNTGVNRLVGNSANNKLDGGGGADTLIGWFGNDTYVVDNAGDVVTEGSNAGIDLVESSVNVDATTLFANIENFTLTGTAASVIGNGIGNTIKGNGSDNTLSGRGGNDSLVGNAGNDTLIGGAGSDTLDGGAGADVLVFETALGASNIDRIATFTSGTDKIQLDDDVFKAFSVSGTTALAASAFVKGATATTAAHRIIVNGSDVLYDADGNGNIAAVKFATLGANITLAVGDFQIIS